MREYYNRRKLESTENICQEVQLLSEAKGSLNDEVIFISFFFCLLFEILRVRENGEGRKGGRKEEEKEGGVDGIQRQGGWEGEEDRERERRTVTEGRKERGGDRKRERREEKEIGKKRRREEEIELLALSEKVIFKIKA